LNNVVLTFKSAYWYTDFYKKFKSNLLTIIIMRFTMDFTKKQKIQGVDVEF